MEFRSQPLKKTISWISLFILVVLVCVSYFYWSAYLNFSTLKRYDAVLLNLKNQHYFVFVFFFFLFCVTGTFLASPATFFIEMIGGYLFGPIAILYVVAGTMLGTTGLFIIVRYSLGDFLEAKVSGWFLKMEKGFQKNSFTYLLFIRLTPFSPTAIVSICSGLLAMPILPFVLATLIGTIPGVCLCVLIGNNLSLFTHSNTNMNIIFSPFILFCFLVLSISSLIPVIYYYWRKK